MSLFLSLSLSLSLSTASVYLLSVSYTPLPPLSSFSLHISPTRICLVFRLLAVLVMYIIYRFVCLPLPLSLGFPGLLIFSLSQFSISGFSPFALLILFKSINLFYYPFALKLNFISVGVRVFTVRWKLVGCISNVGERVILLI